ncbi:hypothetical protein [Streptomyces sp. KL116D]|uniref:hypothetical protein n=1 Tax=Streptomyces sp. KL116D TaxID=3045152 RepID=UPI003556CE0E
MVGIDRGVVPVEPAGLESVGPFPVGDDVLHVRVPVEELLASAQSLCSQRLVRGLELEVGHVPGAPALIEGGIDEEAVEVADVLRDETEDPLGVQGGKHPQREASAVAAFDIEGADAQGVDDRQGALVVVVARVQLDAPRVGRIRRLPGAPG